jgi:hypothetical protein
VDRLLHAFSTAHPHLQAAVLIGVPGAVGLLIGWWLDVSWLWLALQSPRWRWLALAKMRADEANEHDAACRREQAIFDAVLARDRRAHPAPWRPGRGPTI